MPDGASFKTKETVFKLILGIVNLTLKFSRTDVTVKTNKIYHISTEQFSPSKTKRCFFWLRARESYNVN